MREILFRGKRKRDQRWVYGSYLHLNMGSDYICDGAVWIGTMTPCKEEVIPETVGQFTGKIAQDVRVFEGDIFRYGDEVYVVKWDSDSAKFYCYCLDGSSWICDFLEIRWGAAEVIGNIHDNPELLEANHAK